MWALAPTPLSPFFCHPFTDDTPTFPYQKTPPESETTKATNVRNRTREVAPTICGANCSRFRPM